MVLRGLLIAYFLIATTLSKYFPFNTVVADAPWPTESKELYWIDDEGK